MYESQSQWLHYTKEQQIKDLKSHKIYQRLVVAKGSMHKVKKAPKPNSQGIKK